LLETTDLTEKEVLICTANRLRLESYLPEAKTNEIMLILEADNLCVLRQWIDVSTKVSKIEEILWANKLVVGVESNGDWIEQDYGGLPLFLDCSEIEEEYIVGEWEDTVETNEIELKSDIPLSKYARRMLVPILYIYIGLE
jgi:hypothetical protein